ncbi:MAG: EthD family reductase [Ginsengibacter sp.]
MATMMVIYKTPRDKESFLEHYFDVHIPLAKKLRGLIKYKVSQNPVSVITGQDVFLVGELIFASMEDIKSAFASPEGRACAEDRKILAADDKVQIYLYESIEV